MLTVAQRFDCGDMDVWDEDPTFAIGEGQKQLAIHGNDRARIAHIVGGAAAELNAEGLEGITGDQALDLGGRHIPIIGFPGNSEQVRLVEGCENAPVIGGSALNKPVIGR